jgi:TP901 family phage tail tape measure protein
MSEIQSNIRVNIDTTSALESLKALQRQISVFQQEMGRSGAAAQMEASKLQQSLINGINGTGNFTASMTTVASTTEAFTTALEKNKLSMGEYFRYSLAASKSFGKAFSGEFDTIQQVAIDRVKEAQSQYIKLGNTANGAVQAIKIKPATLDMQDLGTKTQIAAQRQQILNQLLTQGSTNLLNWGKNTQWAGRQLMMGFTLPLVAFGQVAVKAFSTMEQSVVDFKRVYGDLNTSMAETNQMADQVQNLAMTFTKYGVQVADTMKLAAEAAAMGKQGADLLAQIDSATTLSVLGGVDQQKALQTTISLTNAFGISADQLKGKINFLNAVENQTVTNISDLTTAIPKAAPVVKQLGGSVEDLTFFLTAMKEGGINAAEGANAIKSGLAAMINPTAAATKMLSGFGINIKQIVADDKGNIRKTVVDFASALDKLDPTNRAQAIEKMFGKFQFARISTLFKNITDTNSQAYQVMKLADQGPAAAQIIADRELKQIQNSPLYQYKKALAEVQAALIPIGKQFLQVLSPILGFVNGALNWFNGLNSGIKSVIGTLVIALGVIGPVVLMGIGLVGNGIANLIKLFANFKSFINNIGKSSKELGSQTAYMTETQLKAYSAASSLEQVHAKYKQTITATREALALYNDELQRMVNIQGGYAREAQKVAVVPNVVTGKMFPETAKIKLERAHLTMPFEPGSPQYENAIASMSPGQQEFAKLFPQNVKVLGGLVADTPYALNQRLKSGGATQEFFSSQWNSRYDKLLGSAQAAGINIEDKKIVESLRTLETKIHDRAIEMAKATESGLIDDQLLADATKEVLNAAKLKTGAMKESATALEKLANQANSIRISNSGLPENNPQIETIQKPGNKKSTTNFISSAGETVYLVSGAGGTQTSPISGAKGYAKYSLLSKAVDENITAVSENTKVVQSDTIQKKKILAQELFTAEEMKVYENSSKEVKGQLTRVRKKQIEIANGEALSDEGLSESEKRYSAMLNTATEEQTASSGGGLFGSSRASKFGNSKFGKFMGSGAGMGAAMGASIGIDALSAVGGPVGQVAGALAPVANFASLGMMIGPEGALAGAALGGLVSVITLVTNAYNDQIKASQKLADSMSATTDKVVAMSQATGTVSYIEAARAKASTSAAGLGTGTTADAALAAGNKILSTDIGKQILDDIATQSAAGKTGQEIGKNLAYQFSSYIAQGVLTTDQAKSLAASIGNKLNDQAITIAITGQMNTILGPNGENLKNNPLDVNIQLIQQSQQTTQGFYKSGDQTAGTTNAYSTYGLTDQAITALKASDQFKNEDSSKQNQDLQKIMEQAKKSRDLLFKPFANLTNDQISSIESANAYQGDKFSQYIKGSSRYSSADQNTKDLMDKNINTINDISSNGTIDSSASILDRAKLAAVLQAQYANNSLNSSNINSVTNLLKTKGSISAYQSSLASVGDIATTGFIANNTQLSGTATTQALSNIGKNKDLIDFYNKISDKKVLETTINMTINGQDKIKSEFDNINKLTNNGTKQITFEAISKGDFAGLKSQAAWFNSLPAMDQKFALQYFAHVNATINDTDVAAWLASKAGINPTTQGSFAETTIANSAKKITDAQRMAYAAKLAKDATTAMQAANKVVGGNGTTPLPSASGAGTSAAQKQADKYTAALNIIGREETAINKTYSDRIAALDKIQQANDKINQQKKDQLTIADALSRGDIAAAAAAAQTAQANAQSSALAAQKQAMQDAQTAAINAITVGGLTRDQITARQNAAANTADYATLGGTKFKFSAGGMVPSYFAAGGYSKGTDIVPAMLTPGEFVIKKSSVDKIGTATLNAINNGEGIGNNESNANIHGGDSVYNYSITVNAETNADAHEIANVVLDKIHRIESQQVRGSRF